MKKKIDEMNKIQLLLNLPKQIWDLGKIGRELNRIQKFKIDPEVFPADEWLKNKYVVYQNDLYLIQRFIISYMWWLIKGKKGECPKNPRDSEFWIDPNEE